MAEESKKTRLELEDRVRSTEDLCSQLRYERTVLEEKFNDSLQRQRGMEFEVDSLRKRERDIAEENRKLRIVLEEKLIELDDLEERVRRLQGENDLLRREHTQSVSQLEKELRITRIETEKYTRKSESELKITKANQIAEEYKENHERAMTLVLLYAIEIERLNLICDLKITEGKKRKKKIITIILFVLLKKKNTM